MKTSQWHWTVENRCVLCARLKALSDWSGDLSIGTDGSIWLVHWLRNFVVQLQSGCVEPVEASRCRSQITPVVHSRHSLCWRQSRRGDGPGSVCSVKFSPVQCWLCHQSEICLQLECAKPDTVSISSTGSDAADAMKIIHKEQDMLTCFCVNEVNIVI